METVCTVSGAVLANVIVNVSIVLVNKYAFASLRFPHGASLGYALDRRARNAGLSACSDDAYLHAFLDHGAAHGYMCHREDIYAEASTTRWCGPARGVSDWGPIAEACATNLGPAQRTWARLSHTCALALTDLSQLPSICPSCS